MHRAARMERRTSTWTAGEAAAARPPFDEVMEHLYRRSLEADGASSLALRDWVERAEAWRIAQALREARGNRSAAARALGIGRRTLYAKMEKLGLRPRWDPWRMDGPAHSPRRSGPTRAISYF